MDEIKPLTSLRGLAALAVVAQHFSASAQGFTSSWIPSLVPHGYVAVDFFFVLSGFIMSLTYLPAFDRDGFMAFPGFMMKRVARIVPLNLFVLLTLLLLGFASRAISDTNIFFDDANLAFDLPANVLMLQGLGIGTNMNGPSWSISTEFAAYFLFPLFVLLVFQRGRFLAALSLLVALVILIAEAWHQPRFQLATFGPRDQILLTFTEFVLGMGTFTLYRYRQQRGSVVGDLEPALLVFGIVVGLSAGVDLLVVLLCPFLIVAMALNSGKWSRWLSGGIPYFLGVVSYSIYLIHQPIRSLTVHLFTLAHPASVGPIAALALALVGTLLVIPFAWLTYLGIERPGRRVVRVWANSFARRGALAR